MIQIDRNVWKRFVLTILCIICAFVFTADGWLAANPAPAWAGGKKKKKTKKIEKSEIEKSEIEKPGTTQPGAENEQTKEPKPKEEGAEKGPRSYQYIFSLPKEEFPDEYSRPEIESFLCAAVPEFIERNDVLLDFIPEDGEIGFGKVSDQLYIRYIEVSEEEKKKMGETEINKWFEEDVKVACSGSPSTKDIQLVRRFFEDVNLIIGRKKFVYNDSYKTGNIVLEFSLRPPVSMNKAKVGEATCLEDNLRAIYYKVKEQMKVETYVIGSGKLVVDGSGLIKYSSNELAFRKKNRIIKVHITNVADSKVRKAVILHELLHAVGLCGHSPLAGCQLFPVQVSERVLSTIRIGKKKLKTVKTSGLLTPQTVVMLEMLYRPEILPGMTVKEAAEILSDLKRRTYTSKNEILEFFESRKAELEADKRALLEIGRSHWERKEEIHKLLYALELKWEKLGREVMKENRFDARFVRGKHVAAILRLNEERVQMALQWLKEEVAQLEEKGANSQRRNSLKRQILLRNEDLGVFSEIMKEVVENENRIRALEEEERDINFQEEDISLLLRRIVRQLGTIAQEIKYLNRAS